MKPVIRFVCLSMLLGFTTLQAQLFPEKATAVGISPSHHSNGAAVADYDQDGDLDIYIVACDFYENGNTRTYNRLYRNNGDGTYLDVAEAAGVRTRMSPNRSGLMGDKQGASWGDYNNDGYPDLFLTCIGPNELYLNNGDGTFTDVTASAGVAGREEDYHSSAIWWDYDTDGDLDIYVGAWIGRNDMFENNGDGTFTDVSEASGLDDIGSTWSAVAFDADNDELIDLYVINDYGWNTFYRNVGNKVFQEATDLFGLADSGNGMGIAIGDYDNNGYFDLYATNIADLFIPTPNPLFQNNGDGTFTNRSIELGVDRAEWAWGTEFFDVDHDLDLDIYVVNGFWQDPSKNVMFENTLETGTVGFTDVSANWVVNGANEARALVTVDYDDDGDLDMLVTNWFNPPYLYENNIADGNWLKIKLEGTVSNRDAYGATVKLTAGGHVLHRINDGVDFYGQSSQPVHFGLADIDVVDDITITWPTGESESYQQIGVNQTIHIIEDMGVVGIEDSPGVDPAALIDNFRFVSQYPNPFNGATNIEFDLQVGGRVTLQIFDLLGKSIYVAERDFEAGRGYFRWDGTDLAGTQVGSGLYFYRLIHEAVSHTGQFLYAK